MHVHVYVCFGKFCNQTKPITYGLLLYIFISTFMQVSEVNPRANIKYHLEVEKVPEAKPAVASKTAMVSAQVSKNNNAWGFSVNHKASVEVAFLEKSQNTNERCFSITLFARSKNYLYFDLDRDLDYNSSVKSHALGMCHTHNQPVSHSHT